MTLPGAAWCRQRCWALGLALHMWLIEPRNGGVVILPRPASSPPSSHEPWMTVARAEHSNKTLIERFDQTAWMALAFASAFSGTTANLEGPGHEPS